MRKAAVLRFGVWLLFITVSLLSLPAHAGPDAGVRDASSPTTKQAPQPVTKPKPKKPADAGADAAAGEASPDAASLDSDASASDAAPADAAEATATPDAASTAEAPSASAPPVPPPAASAAPPASSAEPAKSPEVAQVVVRNRVVFDVRVPRSGVGPKERAKAAADVIDRILEEPDAPPRATIVPLPAPNEFALRIGDRDVFGFGPDDVVSSGLAPEAYAESLRIKIDSFLTAERQRQRLQAWFLSVVLSIFLAIVTMFLLRWVRILSDRAQSWAESKAATLPGLRFKEIEVLSPQALRSSLYVLVGVSRVLLQIGLVYLYLAFTFGQFETTRPWVRQVTSFLISPFVELAERIGLALPAAIVLVVGVYVVRTGVRVTGFFFDHLARGDVKSAWIPAEMAAPARPIARIALVLVALLVLGPVVSGTSEGLIVRIGIVGLATVAVASVPLTAAAAVGAVSIFTGRYRLGEWVIIGRYTGEIAEVGFLDVTLVPVGAGRVRIPHLMSLVVPVVHLAGPPRLEHEIPIDPHASPDDVIKALEQACAPLADSVEIAVVGLSSAAARYRVSLREPRAEARAQVVPAIARALREAGIELGSATPPDAS